MATTGDAELDDFIAVYTPEIAALTHAFFDRLKAHIPAATFLAHYRNALAIGWSPDDRTPNGILSQALYPRWINPCPVARRRPVQARACTARPHHTLCA